MIAGRLTEFVELQEPFVEKDDRFGSDVISYPTGKIVHAEVVWKSGKISEEVSELFPDRRIEVLIYAAHRVEEKWHLVYSGVVYSVSAVEHNRRRGLKRLICDRVND